jgi:NHL repeat
VIRLHEAKDAAAWENHSSPSIRSATRTDGLALPAKSDGCRAADLKALDDRDDLLAPEPEESSLRQKVLRLGPDDAALGFARDCDTSSTTKLQHSFVSKDPKRTEHRVAVDTQDCRHVTGGRQSLTGTDIAVGNIPANLARHLVMERHGTVVVNLDTPHGDKDSVIIVSGSSTALKEAPGPAFVDHDLVIREARRRQRRRWLVIGTVIVAATCAVAAIVGLTGGAQPRKNLLAARPAQSHKVTPPKPAASEVVPERPSSLAIGPNGNLYMADDLRNQVLERLPNGVFKPVVGNGTVGFSGDGGQATNAELNYPAGLTFGPDGTLYIADQNNGRIRAVSSSGVISTVAGSGTGLGWVPNGTPALQASLEPFAMAFGPGGLLYVTSGQQVLRLKADGTFTTVLGVRDESGQPGIGGPAVDASADGPTGLAFDSSGNLYVFGFDSKAILMVDPEGIVHNLGSLYPRGPSGLTTLPNGSVVAMDELGVDELSPQGFRTLVSFPTTAKVSYLGITGFSPNGIAVGANGAMYLDTFYGNGFADTSALIMIPDQGSGAPLLLWSDRPS